jgi:hypothetical protein
VPTVTSLKLQNRLSPQKKSVFVDLNAALGQSTLRSIRAKQRARAGHGLCIEEFGGRRRRRQGLLSSPVLMEAF